MPDLGSIGSVGETPHSSGAGGGGQRRSKDHPEEDSSNQLPRPPENPAPLLNRENRLREISEELSGLQSQLITGGLDEEGQQNVQREIQKCHIAMENLLSLSASGFDPQMALEELLPQLKNQAIHPHPGSLNRLLQAPDS